MLQLMSGRGSGSFGPHKPGFQAIIGGFGVRGNFRGRELNGGFGTVRRGVDLRERSPEIRDERGMLRRSDGRSVRPEGLECPEVRVRPSWLGSEFARGFN